MTDMKGISRRSFLTGSAVLGGAAGFSRTSRLQSGAEGYVDGRDRLGN